MRCPPTACSTKNRFPIDCSTPQTISDRRMPNLVVTTPPRSAPATIEKNPNTFDAKAISGSENPSEI